MKTTSLFTFSTIALIYSGAVIWASEVNKKKTEEVKEEVKPSRPSFPLYMLHPLSSFSLPTLRLPQIPYLQAFSIPNHQSSIDRIRATKTEYVEVTRRQTVHPVCYTVYELKSPCLPQAPLDFHDDVPENFDFDTIHQVNENFQLNDIRKYIQATPTSRVTPTETHIEVRKDTNEETPRYGKYLEFKLRREKDEIIETSTKLEGTEFFPISLNFGNRRQSTEYTTKTVLITKLEKFTDRRVTATLLAMNCLPVDRAIPMCQTYPNPIKEAPDQFIKGNPTLTPYTKQEILIENRDKQIAATINAVKKASQQVKTHKVPTFVFIDRKDSNIDDINKSDSLEELLESNTDKFPQEDSTETIQS